MHAVTLLLFMVLLPTAAFAETHRCTGKDGRTLYTDAACPPEANSETVELIDNSLDYSEWRWRHEQRHPVERRANRESSGKKSHTSRSAGSGSAADSRDCRQAKRHLQNEESRSIDRDPLRIRAARVRVELSCQGPRPIDFRCRTALKNYEVEAASQGNPDSLYAAEAAAREACRR